MTHDPYSRVDYRSLIAWPERIRREWPLIEELLSTAPVRRLLDLGSGTGEHSRFIAEQGYEVVGVDSSESMIERAYEGLLPPNVRFVLGDFRELDKLSDGAFGAAICLGNALPHLTTPEDLERFATGLRSTVSSGGPVLLQVLNYGRIAAKKERALPINFRPDPEGGEIVFLRLMETKEDGTVMFYPTTLRLTPGAEEPLQVIASREVRLRGWRLEELREAFGKAGFVYSTAYGGFDKSRFDPEESRDLVLVIR